MIVLIPRIDLLVDCEGLSVGVLLLDDLRVEKSSSEFTEYEEGVFESIRDVMSLDEMKNDPMLRSYRNLYWTFGMDPTKLRVSSEALLRRVLRGLNFWRVSNLVDVINLASAKHKIPIGLIDLAGLKGDLQIRSAKENEEFVRIGGKKLHCRGREIVIADEEKIVCFGYATHDSELSKITQKTNQALVLLYGAPIVSAKEMESALELTNEMMLRWVDCKTSQRKKFVF